MRSAPLQLENKFKLDFKKDLEDLFPGCYIFVGAADQIQGVPDMIILYGPTWATLEFKRQSTSRHQPNQDYHVEVMNNMSFSAFVYPENREEILSALSAIFELGRNPRVLIR